MRVHVVTVERVDARGRFAIDAPAGARVTSSSVTLAPKLLVRLWVELPEERDVEVKLAADGASVSLVYALRKADAVRLNFRVDGLGTHSPSIRQVHR